MEQVSDTQDLVPLNLRQAEPAQPSESYKPRRAFHHKVKTGCRTCKLRRIRCDEGKPACARCVTTSRTCDYGLLHRQADIPFRPSTHGSSAGRDPLAGPPYGGPVATADLKLVIPRKSTAEMRSYRYFTDVACPAVAGSFDVDLWMREIPQASFADPAIWHAAVSLGSVYEYHVTMAFTGHKPYERNEFALAQLNASIRHLTSAPLTTPESRWRALTVSIIFVCICCLEGLLEEARMHYQYGYKLLREIESELDVGDITPGSTDEEGSRGDKPTYRSPVSIQSLRRILCCFELREVTLFNGGIIELPTIHADQDLYRAWMSYVPPSSPAERHLSLDNMAHANRAAQSLSNSCLVFSQDHTGELVQAFADPSEDIADLLAAKREPLLQCFRDIDTAIGIFQQVLGPESEDRSGGMRRTVERKQLRLALLSLRLSHETNRFMLAQYPDWLHLDGKDETGVGLSRASCSTVLDVAEETEALQNELRTWGGGASVPPIAMITLPLCCVALMGSRLADRRRALHALRRPRVEGLLEHGLSSSLAAAILAREMEMAEEVARSEAMQLETNAMRLLDGTFHPMCRVNTTKIEFTGGRQADIVMRTWHEMADGQPGKKVRIDW